MNVKELHKTLNSSKSNSRKSAIKNEVHELMNPNHFQGLLESKIRKSISADSLDYLFQEASDKVQRATIRILVFADGYVVYSEDSLKQHNSMYLKNHNDTSEYSGKLSRQTMGTYKSLLQSCLEAERVLTPKRLVPKEYSIGLEIKKGLWNDISYSIRYLEDFNNRKR